jgi:PASTA domain
LLLISVVAAATAWVPASAEANTVAVGSTLTAPGFALLPFGPPATVANYSLPAPAIAASPVDGTIVSWRFIGEGGPLTPRVLRSVNGTTLTGAGTGTPQNAAAPGSISGPFPVSIPIKRGDFFGADGASGTSLSTAPAGGAVSLYFDPPLTDDSSLIQSPTGTNSEEDALSATVRFCLVPKLKGLTGKAARQALQAADCRLGQITKGGKRRHRVKRIRTQSVKAGKSISDTQRIDLTISRKRK